MPHEFNTSTFHVTATAVNGLATATKAAVAGRRHYITSISFSANGAVAAAVSVLVKSGTTVIAQYELPAAAFSTIALNFDSPLACAPGELASIEIPALGTGIRGTVNLHGFSAA